MIYEGLNQIYCGLIADMIRAVFKTSVQNNQIMDATLSKYLNFGKRFVQTVNKGKVSICTKIKIPKMRFNDESGSKLSVTHILN